jgi:site-specific DNA recombinase
MSTAIYARVSTLDQDNEDKTSIETQIAECTKYCIAKGLVPNHVLSDTMSGNKLDRPELNKLRALVRSKEIDVIVCYSDDRLTRNPSHWLVLLEELKMYGVSLHYANTGMVEFSPEGEMLSGIKSHFNQYWLQKIVETMLRGKYGKAAQGNYIKTSRMPYGYDYNEETKELVINEIEANVIRRIFDMLLNERLSTYAISDRLNAEGVPTPLTAKQWGSATIQHLIKRTENIGIWVFGKDIQRPFSFTVSTEVPIPPLVSREMYEQAKEQLKSNKRIRKPLADRYNHLFANRVICKCCGYKAYAHSTKKNGKVYSYYTNTANQNKTRCTTPGYKAIDVDNAVWQYICDELLNPKNLEDNLLSVQQELRQNSKLTELNETLSSLTRALDKLEQTQQSLLDATMSGSFPKHLVASKSNELEQTRQSLLAEIKETEEHIASERVLTDSDISDITSFAALITEKLQVIKDDRVTLEKLFDLLGIEVVLDYDHTTKTKYLIVNSILDTNKVLDISEGVSISCLICKTPIRMSKTLTL